MIKTFKTSIEAGFTLPSHWTVATHAAAVRTLPTMGGVSAVAGAAGTKRRVEGQVCINTGTTTVFVLDGAFPGTSVWSPPI